jgi:hypothetical protein
LKGIVRSLLVGFVSEKEVRRIYGALFNCFVLLGRPFCNISALTFLQSIKPPNRIGEFLVK